ATETDLQLQEVVEAPAGQTLLSRIKQLLGTAPAPKPTQEGQFAEMGEIVTELAQGQASQGAQFAALKAAADTAQGELAQLREDFNALHKQLSRQPDPGQPLRPAVTGGDSTVLTDC
ncbi:GPO family capsid scaffolding protein, partial [Xanthomonas translucens]|uniref:GPO family capsid scaffolding protein n=1 Tax=Xanthomonas campestris pv. translucens TaxID=343 RepID=UPI00073B0F71